MKTKTISSGQELSAAEATRKLGITMDALYRLIYAAKLPAKKEGGKWRIPAKAVEDRIRAKAAK